MLTTFPIPGMKTQSNLTPIFKLLQAYKLQQYSKPLMELGYKNEIFKLLCLSEAQSFGLLNKLNLMPGHRARFNEFFESMRK